MITTTSSTTDNDPTDVLILAILPEEYRALACELAPHGPGLRYPGVNLYGWHSYQVNDYRVVLGSAGNNCNDFMQAAAGDGLRQFAPAVLLVVGIGGGLPKDRDPMCPGDIVLGNAVWSVDRGKIGVDGLQARPLGVLVGGGLVACVQELAIHRPGWCDGLRNADDRAPRIIVGAVAASNQVQTIDSHEIVRAARAVTGDMVRAVDMESAGAAMACENYHLAAQKPVLLGIIRGLSDIVRPLAQAANATPGVDCIDCIDCVDCVDGGKTDNATAQADPGADNSDQRNHWKDAAATHAARLALALIQHYWPYPAAQRLAQSKPPTEPNVQTAPAALAAPAAPVDVARIGKAPDQLIGRDTETAWLDDAWAKAVRGETPRPRVLTLVALGGEGKTSLVAKWAAQLADMDWPGCEAAYAWSFYSQGTESQVAASSDLFLNDALMFFGDAETARSAQSGFDKARRLAALIGARRALLFLDGLEPLQYAPTSPMPGELRDQGMAALLKGLAASNRGLCVVTTRYSIPDLRGHWQTTAPERAVSRLTGAAGAALLLALGVTGRGDDILATVEEVKGHALTLNLLGGYLRDAHAGDVRMRAQVRLQRADALEQGGHAFRVMDAYVAWLLDADAQAGGTGTGTGRASARGAAARAQGRADGQRAVAVLRLLGLFDRPAGAACLDALREAPVIAGLTEALFAQKTKWFGLRREARALPASELNVVYARLEAAKLLSVQRNPAGALVALDAHPLLREYFACRLQSELPDAWRAAHRRLFGHLCATTQDKERATLEDLQPLYQAVAHGCLAGMRQEACVKVYRDRILRGGEAYSTHKLGAFASDLGAVACFFEQAWSRVSSELGEADQAWLLAVAAFSLRALGRLREALEPMRAGLAMAVGQEDWENAAIAASNLSGLALTLGETAVALGDAAQAVEYAERCGDWSQRMGKRATHADALHQAGQGDAASQRFREAEAIQAGYQPGYPLLYSLRGFWYCDLLLAGPERAAWRRVLSGADARPLATRGPLPAARADAKPAPHAEAPPDAAQDRCAAPLASCDAVSRRARQTLQWVEQANLDLLSIALDHLTLGRAALLAAILQDTPPAVCQPAIQRAVDGLRRSGNMHHLPRALLARAWLRALTGAPAGPDSAQADLDEALEVAERGPMPLFIADILLARARLFGPARTPATPYPWQSPAADLAESRRLIEQHGYLRRIAELQDAEAALSCP